MKFTYKISPETYPWMQYNNLPCCAKGKFGNNYLTKKMLLRLTQKAYHGSGTSTKGSLGSLKPSVMVLANYATLRLCNSDGENERSDLLGSSEA